ncbi:hypothetical protein DOTSEDRAFT_75476 [Dothistroma septosporum NZE10]|uniref:Glycosyl transferase CAP10 domain-containing protein n=1 Tax=Dothistroma septosporum (strain NZE10 / CBS 128990) TaxID=675120 RepID=M2Y093_DOTSN|nr:hypothetical protein DOTSEDRAFT_75476 [Dothistroma septosporum NZE10]
MESITTWKRTCYALAGLTVLQFIFLLNNGLGRPSVPGLDTACELLTERFREVSQQTAHQTDIAPQVQSKAEQLLPWDQLPRGADGEIVDNLSEAQCDFAFPDLYKDIDRAKDYWKQRGHSISSNDTNINWNDLGVKNTDGQIWRGLIRLLIHDNQIRVLQGVDAFGGYRPRSKQALFLLHRAVESATAAGQKLPTIELAMSMPDITDMPSKNGTRTVWAFNRRIRDPGHQRHWLLPNFDLWGQGNSSYQDSKLSARAHDAPFRSKIPKIVWRGSAWVNMDIRQKMINIGGDNDWADMKKLDGDHNENSLPVGEWCRYAMTVHTEGVSYSGRMKWLTNCNSLIFFHEREWDMYYYHLLEASGPNQNYVAVKRDWSDLEEKVLYYLDHPEEAERIIANNMATFRDRYLTRAATSCYTRKLIQGYAEVSFQPATQRPASERTSALRGVPYEAFMMNVGDIGDENS